MKPEQQRQQWQFRYEHKKLCAERALERGDCEQYAIFCAQAAYYRLLLTGEPLTAQNRNTP
jgi:hypothetical protein